MSKRPVPIQFQRHDSDDARLEKLRRLAEQLGDAFSQTNISSGVDTVFTSDANGLVPAPGNSTGFLRYDGVWADIGESCDCEQIEADILALQTGLAATDVALTALTSTVAGLATSLGFKANQSLVLTAGAGLTGGGSLSTDRTFTVGAGTGITVNADDVALSAASLVSLALADTSVQPARTLTAGAGLTGGGTLAADRTFNVGAGTGITVNADDVQIATAYQVANPSGLIGMSAVNGTATSPLRSDGRHAIDPAIAPTWTGVHTWSRTASTASPGISFQGDFVNNEFSETDAGVNEKNWHITINNKQFLMRTISDARNAAADWLTVDRSGLSVTGMTYSQAGASTVHTFYGNVRLATDNQELQLGASQDLRLFHDGTDSWVRNDTGVLKLSSGATSVFEVTAARGTFNTPYRSKAYTVATLPAGAQGDRAHVTDALAPVFLGIIAGGGAVVTPVFFNGTNWVAE